MSEVGDPVGGFGEIFYALGAGAGGNKECREAQKQRWGEPEKSRRGTAGLHHVSIVRKREGGGSLSAVSGACVALSRFGRLSLWG